MSFREDVVQAVRAVVAAVGAEGFHAVGDEVVDRADGICRAGAAEVTAEAVVRKKGHDEQVRGITAL